MRWLAQSAATLPTWPFHVFVVSCWTFSFLGVLILCAAHATPSHRYPPFISYEWEVMFGTSMLLQGVASYMNDVWNDFYLEGASWKLAWFDRILATCNVAYVMGIAVRRPSTDPFVAVAITTGFGFFLPSKYFLSQRNAVGYMICHSLWHFVPTVAGTYLVCRNMIYV